MAPKFKRRDAGSAETPKRSRQALPSGEKVPVPAFTRPSVVSGPRGHQQGESDPRCVERDLLTEPRDGGRYSCPGTSHGSPLAVLHVEAGLHPGRVGGKRPRVRDAVLAVVSCVPCAGDGGPWLPPAARGRPLRAAAAAGLRRESHWPPGAAPTSAAVRDAAALLAPGRSGQAQGLQVSHREKGLFLFLGTAFQTEPFLFTSQVRKQCRVARGGAGPRSERGARGRCPRCCSQRPRTSFQALQLF